VVVEAVRTKVVEPKLVNETIVFVEPGEGLEFVGVPPFKIAGL
jgi:hypothetical protein